jgi:hypothetical protein
MGLPNPYTPSDRPRVFVGRDAERDRLRGRLARVAAYGEMMGPLVVVTGPRGVGKTSLLRDVASQAEQDGFVVAWVAGVKHQPFLGELVDRVTRALERAEVVTASTGVRVGQLGVELNAGIAKISARIERTHDGAAPTALVGPLEDFLGHASALVRERGGAGLVVMIDELHAPLESGRERDYAPDPGAVLDAAVLLNAIQDMGAERERYPIGVVGAGLPQTKGLLTRAATFGERSHEIVLGELDDGTAAQVLTAPAEQLRVTWDDAALAAAVTAADGYPQSLQIIGSATWDAARPASGDTLTLADLERGWETAQNDLVSLFEARWSVATESERAFLVAMAGLDGPVVRRGAIADALGVPTEALGMVRRNLINKGIVEDAGRGLLRFTVPGFDRFVLAQDPPLPRGPHRELRQREETP